jgi:DNA-binding MarR family transcriptional regulator
MSNRKKPRVATEASNKNQLPHHFNRLGPVDKLKYLCIAAADSSLSRCDLASLVTIANGTNSLTGVTWRSSNTLARETGSTSRTAKRSIKKLVEKGYIKITEKGNRGGKANTYSLGEINAVSCSVTEVTTSINSLVTPLSESSGDDDISLMTVMSPLSMTLSELKARIERNRLADDDAMPCGMAGAPSGKHRPGKDKYPDFWTAFPIRAGVALAEKILEKLIADGVDYGEIIAAAWRYKKYCEKSNKRVSADAWLERESWRDDWTPQKTKNQTKKSQTLIQKLPEILTWDEWEIKSYDYWQEFENKMDLFYAHQENCVMCKKSSDEKYLSEEASELCKAGKAIMKEVGMASDDYDNFAKLEPKKEI